MIELGHLVRCVVWSEGPGYRQALTAGLAGSSRLHPSLPLQRVKEERPKDSTVEPTQPDLCCCPCPVQAGRHPAAVQGRFGAGQGRQDRARQGTGQLWALRLLGHAGTLLHGYMAHCSMASCKRSVDLIDAAEEPARYHSLPPYLPTSLALPRCPPVSCQVPLSGPHMPCPLHYCSPCCRATPLLATLLLLRRLPSQWWRSCCGS